MHLTGHMQLLLVGILEDSQEAARQPAYLKRLLPPGVRIDFGRWLGVPPTRSESACLSRALSGLRDRGLVCRLPCRRVELTAEGRRLAKHLLRDEAPTDRMGDGPPLDLADVQFLPIALSEGADRGAAEDPEN
jgi:hypothetical protein